LSIKEVDTVAFDDQKPGTAGLRKPVSQFKIDHYLENFVQSVFDAVPELAGETLVLGGDGRYFNPEAAERIIRMAHANGVRRVVLGRQAMLSTPAAAHLIAQEQAAGGFILTASHNPGGPEGDFGIKFNVRGGGQASAELTEKIYSLSREIRRYRISDIQLPPLDQVASSQLDDMRLDVVDPVEAHVSLLASQFDFKALGDWLSTRPSRFIFNAMHAVTGPYARSIFIDHLGASEDCLLNATPLPDFGGGHPDPNPIDAADFMQHCQASPGLDLAAASDGDGDRNMILGSQGMVSPCDSLAVIAANHQTIPGLKNGLRGVARSMPTSRALDAVASELGIPCYETPTGWRFFASLLDEGKIRLCGEESFGTSSDHVREKDGLWAVLAWMQMLAARQCTVEQLLQEHWGHYGRHYFQRHDFSLSAEAGDAVMQTLGQQADAGKPELSGNGASMDRFHYEDPISGHRVENQGIRLFLPEQQGRVVYRLSGTGTRGATLRVYLEKWLAPDEDWRQAAEIILAPLARQARDVAQLASLGGKKRPDAMI